jgi:hypothetical protein
MLNCEIAATAADFLGRARPIVRLRGRLANVSSAAQLRAAVGPYTIGQEVWPNMFVCIRRGATSSATIALRQRRLAAGRLGNVMLRRSLTPRFFNAIQEIRDQRRGLAAT